MGDEADAIVERMSNPFRGLNRVEKLARDADVRALLASASESGKKRGYEQGKEATRGDILMKMAKWNNHEPEWYAHVAIEDFKCDCNYGFGFRNECEAYRNATDVQKREAFKNVYGYDYVIWKQMEAKKNG